MGRNECAQRAAEHLLRVPAARLARTHPPNTPLRLLGTTPAQLARLLTAYGRASQVLPGATWSDLAPSGLACIDLRALRGGLPRLHWVLIQAVEPERVRVEGRWVARSAFEKAWRCAWSPFRMHRRALVLPR